VAGIARSACDDDDSALCPCHAVAAVIPAVDSMTSLIFLLSAS
jgi:hypothetical protein